MPLQKKRKVAVFIDGSNFYHRLKELGIKNQLEFNFASLIKFLVNKDKLVNAAYFVGAIRTEKGNAKSLELFRDQNRLIGFLKRQHINVSLGYLLKIANTYHEKGVDVQIATSLLRGAFRNQYQRAYLVSSDSDLIPAIVECQSVGREIVYIGFKHKPSLSLLKTCNQSKLLTQNDLRAFIKK